MPAFPYKAELMWSDEEVWWPVSSDPEDGMVVGDGIPGDKKTAEFAARCCNIAYEQAVSDVLKALEQQNEKIREHLLSRHRCDECRTPAVWIRRAERSGDDHFCDEHAQKEEDFGTFDPASFFWERISI